jgi:hypothetical protein
MGFHGSANIVAGTPPSYDLVSDWSFFDHLSFISAPVPRRIFARFWVFSGFLGFQA